MSLFKSGQALVKNFHKIKPSWKVNMTYISVDPDFNGNVVSFFTPAQGFGPFLRIGRQVRVRAIRPIIILGNQQLTSLSYLRMSILLDKHPNGSTPGYFDIFNNLGTPPSLNTIKYWEGRFVPIADYFRSYLPLSTSTDQLPEVLDDWYDVDFVSTFPNIQVPQTNGIVFAAVSNSGPNTLNPDVIFYCEVYFEDE